MTVRKLVDAFALWEKSELPMVLASVYATEGSTYSKSGAQMLIRGDGVFQGMLSGGCLEGDLALRAKVVAESSDAQAVTYDLGSDDEELWGLGVGCDGLIRVFLQLLRAEKQYQPFPAMQAAFEGLHNQVAATVVASSAADLAVGSSQVMQEGSIKWSDIAETYQERICEQSAISLREKRSQTVSGEIGGQPYQLLLTLLRPYPSILLLGGGMDAEPIVRFITEMGWRVVVSDHRAAYIDNGDFRTADRVCCIVASDVGRELELNKFDAAIVMSHHLLTDELYLRQLAASDISYIGLLGPINRKQRLMACLGDDATLLQGRLRGPAGIDIKAAGPAAIALSIVAELQAHLS